MTDKEILEEIYRRVVTIAANGDANVPSQVRFKEFRDFIESEWQKRDELDYWRTDMFNLADEGQTYNMNSVDAAEIERHRGLVIGEDGTVEELK